MITPRDVHWLAGLLEGEATFGMWQRHHRSARGRGHSRSAFLSLKMTDRDVVERAASLMQCCSVYTDKKQQPHHKTAYSTRSHGIKAIGWMMTLYGLVGNRRQARIREIVTAWKAIPCAAQFRQTCPKGHAYTRRPNGHRRCIVCAVQSNKRQRALHNIPEGELHETHV